MTEPAPQPPQPPTADSTAKPTSAPNAAGKSTAAPAAAAAPAAQAPTGVIVGRGRYSNLIQWMLRLFLFFQGLAIVQALFDIAWPTNFIDFPWLIGGFSCLQNFAVIPMVLGVATWILTKTNRYHPAANRLAKLVVLHFVLRVVGMLLAAVTIFMLILAAAPNLLNSQNPYGSFQAAIGQMVTDHSLLFRCLQTLVLLFELIFTGLALLAKRALRGGHFLPPVAAAEAPTAWEPVTQPAETAPATSATAELSGAKPPAAAAGDASVPPPPTTPPGSPGSAPPNTPPPPAGGSASPSGE